MRNIMNTTSTDTKKTALSRGEVRFLTITALFVALTYVFTAFINIRLPQTAVWYIWETSRCSSARSFLARKVPPSQGA